MICKYLFKFVSFSIIWRINLCFNPRSAQIFRDIIMLTDLLLLVYLRRLEVQITFHSRLCVYGYSSSEKKVTFIDGEIFQRTIFVYRDSSLM